MRTRSKPFRERADMRALGATSPLLGATGPPLGANNSSPWEVRIPGFACLGNGPPGLAAFQESTRIFAKSVKNCDFHLKREMGGKSPKITKFR